MGSQFRNPGLFEVTKATNPEDTVEQRSTDNRALDVTVGSDLEGTAQVRVAIVTSGKQLEIASIRGRNSSPFSFSNLRNVDTNINEKKCFIRVYKVYIVGSSLCYRALHWCPYFGGGYCRRFGVTGTK